MKFDLISDIHLDQWVRLDSNLAKMERNIRVFIQLMLPSKPSTILVIAGDLGHYNQQNLMMIGMLKESYSYILYTHGNHDLYLISGQQKKKYKHKSIRRWNEMKEMTTDIAGVHALDGEIVEIEGVVFGGAPGWYDMNYGIKELGMTMEDIQDLWYDKMNDPKQILGKPVVAVEVEKVQRIAKISDVIFTHVGPDYSVLREKYKKDPVTSFYYFDGRDIISQTNAKVWCFGHTHYAYDYHVGGVRLINNALGYPPQKNVAKKIKTVDI